MAKYPATRQENPTLGEVLAKMVELAWEGHNDIEVRRNASRLTRSLASGEHIEEAKAILREFSPPLFRYVKDPVDNEFLQGLKELHQTRQGDCDDISIGINAYLMALGHDCSFVPVSFARDGSPSHVFARMETDKGPMVLDPVAGPHTPEMLRDVKAFMVIPCNADPARLRGGGGVLDGVFRGWAGWKRRTT